MPRRLVCDRWLFFTAGLLVVAGLFVVGSASHYRAMKDVGTPYLFVTKQAIHLLAGLAGLGLAMSLPYRKLANRWLVLALLGLSVALLIVVLVLPPVAATHRWIRIGPVSFQPSELAKLVTVVFMAFELGTKRERVNELWGVPIPCLGVVGLMAFLILIEPDLGGAVMLVIVPLVMLFVAGLRWKLIGAVVGIGAAAFAAAVAVSPYKLERITIWVRSLFDPNLDTQGPGFQLAQSIIAIGSGGGLGVGPGQGQQKAYFLPEAHTDFIFSVVGEELGLWGTGLLLVAFLVLFWRGIRAALRAPDPFGCYLALGITNLLVLQALINMAVCLGLLPTTGLPLPFISYGGSSLVVSMTAMGLLLNVSQYAE